MKRPFYRAEGKTWYHPSVISLAEENGFRESPENIIIGKARKFVATGLSYDWSGPPFDPSLLASILGIRPVQVDNIEAEAQIVPYPKQFELQFKRKDVTDKRLNFTFCHEIIHTAFPDASRMIHQRNANRATFDPEREVEYLCDIGAAELLMPSPYFEQEVAKLGVTLISVEQLSDLFKASREAVIRRIPSTNLKSCAVIYMGMGYRKGDKAAAEGKQPALGDSFAVTPKPKLRVKGVYPSKDFNLYIPNNKSIPDESQIYALLRGEEFVSCDEEWDIKGFGKRQVEAVRLYSFQKSTEIRVLALVH